MKTVRVKVKREAYPWLNAAAVEVNQVWNWAAEYCQSRIRNGLSAPTGFALTYLAKGWHNNFDKINGDTIRQVLQEYAEKRKQTKKQRLRWRVSLGPRRSLGWVPIMRESLFRKGKSFRFCGKMFRVFEQERVTKWRSGCFAQDSVGDWWLCVPVESELPAAIPAHRAVGLDLGIIAIATTSDGEKLNAGRWTSANAERLAAAQRRGHKRRAKRIHRKLARCRADALHKFSTSLVKRYQRIYVGDVSSPGLARTTMAKSVLDSGWGMLRTQLEYKCQQAAREFRVIDEKYTSVTCSSCGSLSGPRGVNGLIVRNWICDCGESHDRDVNAARNILFRGETSPSVCGNEAESHERRAHPAVGREAPWASISQGGPEG
jgi:putative transposase